MKNLMTSLLFACAMLVGVSACEDTKELYNCAVICETYVDCASELGADEDYTSCVSDCENDADQDDNFNQKASDCQECLEVRDSCSESFVCADECADVVPTVVF